MARILIVEDQKIMQKYFEFIILQDPDLKLVDTISDAREAVRSAIFCHRSGSDGCADLP